MSWGGEEWGGEKGDEDEAEELLPGEGGASDDEVRHFPLLIWKLQDLRSSP
jgi:hypothetical protein